MDIGKFSMLRGAKRAPNKFGYKSRFYDEKKENFEQRLKSLDREIAFEKGEQTDSPSRNISFSRGARTKEQRDIYKRSNNRSNMTIIGLVIFLCSICYYVLKLAQL